MNLKPHHFRELIPPGEPTKLARVLHALACGDTFNRFEAERQLHDHALNSTVSELANGYGVGIQRTWEKVPGYQGRPSPVVRYSMDTAPGNLTACWWLLLRWGYTRPGNPDASNPDASREAA